MKPEQDNEAPCPLGLPLTARCLHCRYLLRGLVKPVCPECGRRFDPEDSLTYYNESINLWRRIWGAPPPKWHQYLICGIALVVLLDISSPGNLAFLWPCGLVLILGISVVDYGLRCTFRSKDTPNPDAASQLPTKRKNAWLVTPICLVIMLGIVLFPWPFWLRFQISKHAFEQKVKEVVDQGPMPSLELDVWLGSMHVESVYELAPGVVFFRTGSCDLFDSCGVVFLRNGTTINTNSLEILSPLGGNWHEAVMPFN